MQIRLTYDGIRYYQMGEGGRVPRPFALRWLMPRLCGTEAARWRAAQVVALVACSALAWPYTHAWAAMFVPLGLAGVCLFNLRYSVLVDLPAMAFALGAAVCVRHGWWPAVVVLAFLAGMTKETAPVFAAAWAWSWVPLLGLVAPLVALWLPYSDDDPVIPHDVDGAAEALVAPVRAAWAVHIRDVDRFHLLLAPWGALLVGLGFVDVRAGVVVALAYGQLVVATDVVRLYQWAWPTLAALTFAHVPRAWWPVVVAAHLANPAKTEGL